MANEYMDVDIEYTCIAPTLRDAGIDRMETPCSACQRELRSALLAMKDVVHQNAMHLRGEWTLSHRNEPAWDDVVAVLVWHDWCDKVRPGWYVWREPR